MATLSAAHTPPPPPHHRTTTMTTTPSTSTSTLLSRLASPSSHLTPKRACHALLDDEASSSDKENSPAAAYMAHNASNTTTTTKTAQSPSINTSLISEKTSVSFTPQRVKAPPRAWERRPATPHVPRNEQQRIWKRVPLGEIGIGTDGNGRDLMGIAMGDMMRSEREEKKDYVRIVKRLKMDGSAEPGVSLESKESRSGNGIALGTKVEMDQIEMMGSPKKKMRRSNGVEVEIVKADMEVDIDVGDVSMEDKIAESVPFEKKVEEEITTQLETPEHDLARKADAATQFSCVTYAEEIVDMPVETSDANKELVCDESNISHVNVLAARGTNAVRLFTEGHHDEQIPVTEDNSVTEPLLVTEVPNLNESTDSSGSLLPLDESKPEQSPDVKPIINDLIEQSLDVHPEIAATESIHVPDTSTAIEAPLAQSEIEQPISSTAESDDTDEPTAIDSMTVFSGTDQSETAFLHEFLLRAKASKAARDASSQLPMHSSAQLGVQAGSDIAMLSSDPLLEDDIEDPEATSPIKRSPATQTESGDNDKSSSPVRRSARTAQKSNTKLSRPGSLPPVPQFGPVLPSQHFPVPNTIQLRRATGTEFIFNAKMQQNLAITTRANTKRNQGPAIHVTERLAQLRSEFPIEAPTEKEDGQTAMIDTLNTASPYKKGVSHKRKIAKGQGTNKVKKNVQWNEVLTSFQEAQSLSPSKPTSEDFAEIEANAQAEAMQAMDDEIHHHEVLQLYLPVKNVQVISPTDEVSEAKASALIESSTPSTSSSSKLKVRNLRRINIGSVNGTPAPKKTRSQSQSQSLRYYQLPKSVPESTTNTSSAITTTNVLAPQQSNIPKSALSSSLKASALPVVQTGIVKTGAGGKSVTSTSTLAASSNTSVIGNATSGRRSLRGVSGVNSRQR